jgi:hypothetical protein
VRPSVPLRQALADPQLLGGVLAGTSWQTWRTLLIAAMGEALTDAERATFKQLTRREREPLARVEELIGVVGRRGGKSRAMALLACYIAGLCKHDLVAGENGVLLCIAPDSRQSSIVLGYAEATLHHSPILRQLIAGRSGDTLTLTNNISIEVRASSFRRLRGPTYIAVICDEAAFYYSDEFSANADSEILNAVRPGLATTGGPLIIASSPYAKRGVLFETHKRHYGPDGDPLILVAQGASREFNPSLPQSVVDRALERDHAAASAEYLATFRTDIESFISREAVEACVEQGIRERAPTSGVRYLSFTDSSGGSGDSMVTAVGHMEGDLLLVDAVREIKSPFDPESATEELVQMMARYFVNVTRGDRYAAQWCAQAFEKRQIRYEHAELNKSQLYLEMLPRINAKTIRLLDHPRTINQICNLERRTARGGRDSIDHPPGGNDDCANAIAGLCGLAAAPRYRYDTTLSWVSSSSPAEAERDFLRQRFQHHLYGGFRQSWR